MVKSALILYKNNIQYEIQAFITRLQMGYSVNPL